MRQRRGLGCLVALIGLISLSCSNDDSAASTTEMSLAALDLEIKEDEIPQPVPDPDDPFAVFGLASDSNDVAATNSVTPVWLINTTSRALVVTAAGGAEVVVLDTIDGADSAFVRIETRARTVVLEAVARGSVSLGSVAVPMDAEPKRVAFPR